MTKKSTIAQPSKPRQYLDTGESGETYDVEMEANENYQVVELKRLREWQKYVREVREGEEE